MRSTRVFFDNQAGNKLAAFLDMPATGSAHTIALFAHCFTCNKDYKIANYISRALTANGIAVCRMDFTGLGDSEGTFANSTFSQNVSDVIAAANYLEQHYHAPQLLIGHSLGGLAVVVAAAKVSSARAVVTIASPSEPAHLVQYMGDVPQQLAQYETASLTVGEKQYTIDRHFFEDLISVDMKSALRALKRPLLVMHSPQDKIVDISNAAEIFQYASHPRSFISLDGADHLLSKEIDARYAGSLIAAWSLKYVEQSHVEIARTDEENRVYVRTGGDGYFTEVIASGHPLVADEPVSLGGSDRGPNPYDLLCAALGACTTMTLRMYADRKKWPLREVTVEIFHNKVISDSDENGVVKSVKIDKFRREIQIFGDLSEEQKTRLLEIAEKCPVHRTLHQPVVVETYLVD